MFPTDSPDSGELRVLLKELLAAVPWASGCRHPTSGQSLPAKAAGAERPGRAAGQSPRRRRRGGRPGVQAAAGPGLRVAADSDWLEDHWESLWNWAVTVTVKLESWQRRPQWLAVTVTEVTGIVTGTSRIMPGCTVTVLNLNHDVLTSSLLGLGCNGGVFNLYYAYFLRAADVLEL